MFVSLNYETFQFSVEIVDRSKVEDHLEQSIIDDEGNTQIYKSFLSALVNTGNNFTEYI